MESLIDKNTAAIVLNNPSNPCGSVYDKKHLLEILALAERHSLPIIADEIYDFFVSCTYIHIYTFLGLVYLMIFLPSLHVSQQRRDSEF